MRDQLKMLGITHILAVAAQAQIPHPQVKPSHFCFHTTLQTMPTWAQTGLHPGCCSASTDTPPPGKTFSFLFPHHSSNNAHLGTNRTSSASGCLCLTPKRKTCCLCLNPALNLSMREGAREACWYIGKKYPHHQVELAYQHQWD